jgi:hypothetical protein
MANGFQGELRQVLDEPMRELKDTADMMRNAVNFDDNADVATPPAETPAAPPPVKREQGLNFGSANPRRSSTDTDALAASAAASAADAEVKREPGLNFGSASPARPKPARDPLAASAAAAADIEPSEAVDAEPAAVSAAAAEFVAVDQAADQPAMVSEPEDAVE